MQQKDEPIKLSLEEIIDKLKQANLRVFEKVDLCSLLMERLGTITETNENKVKWLLSQQLSPDIINNLFCEAAKQGHLAFVTLLAVQDNVDVTTDNNAAIRLAAKNGHLDMIKYLMTLPGVDPAALNNDVFHTAIGEGHLNVVQFLTHIPSVDPSTCKGYAFRWAVENGHLNVVKYLATLPNIDPTADSNYAFHKAAAEDHLNIIRFLITLPGVGNNSVFGWAARKGHLDIVKFLVTLPNVKPTAGRDFSFCHAAECNQLAVIKFLAQKYYNPFERGITLEKKQERIKLLNKSGQKDLIKDCLAKSLGIFTYLFFKNPDSPLNKDTEHYIAEIAIKNELQSTLTK